MIIELAHFALILAMLAAVAQAGAALFLKQKQSHAVTVRAARLQFILCLLSYAGLTYAYLVSDFSVLNVVENSHSYKPLIYKISGVWGNHEGSMLLWVLILSFFGFLMAQSTKSVIPAKAGIGEMKGNPVPDRDRNDTLRNKALQIHGLLGAGFLSFVLFASSPFTRVPLPPADGNDLNPLLQDPALAIHPPLLYIGYIGFSVAFAYAVAGLWAGKIDKSWAKTVKPWVLASWTSLSAGIALGSWWAYYELGWGGWWFWDPVENASLLPWLCGTAFLHSVIVLEKRGGLNRWTTLLAILTFSLSMLGTFLVRSGVLTSVHTFALDPARGLYILILLGLFTGGALTLFALKANTIPSGTIFKPLSREGVLVLNNLLLVTIAVTVLTGILYPLLVSTLTDAAISVGPPYFNATVIPLAIPLVILMGIGPFLPWKTGSIASLRHNLQAAVLVVIIGGLITIAADPAHLSKSLLGMGLSLWLVTATLSYWSREAGLQKKSKTSFWHRIRKMNLSHWSLTLAHLGLGVAIIGMIGTGLWTKETLTVLNQGQDIKLGAYSIQLDSVTPAFGPNYSAIRATIQVTSPRGNTFTLTPETRHYPVAQKQTTEAAIRTGLWDDVYVTIGGRDIESGGWIIRGWVHPGVPFLWLGFVLIVAGGLTGMTDYIRRKGGSHT